MAADEIPQRDALDLFLAMIAGAEPHSGLFEIRTKRAGIKGMRQVFVPLSERDRAIRCITNHGQVGDTYVGVAPRTRESGGLDSIARVWCLWVDIDSPDAVHRLKNFRPLPSIVIRSGSEGHLHAYWPLSKPLAPAWARRANRRLAVHLGGDRNATDGARIMRPPLTRNHKHQPAVPVTCTRLELDVFETGDVVGGLQDDPAEQPRQRRLTAPATTTSPSSAVDGLIRTVRDAAEGNRNASLYWSVCRLVEGQLDAPTAIADMRAAAIHAGLLEDEIDRTIASAYNQRAAA